MKIQPGTNAIVDIPVGSPGRVGITLQERSDGFLSGAATIPVDGVPVKIGVALNPETDSISITAGVGINVADFITVDVYGKASISYTDPQLGSTNLTVGGKLNVGGKQVLDASADMGDAAHAALNIMSGGQLDYFQQIEGELEHPQDPDPNLDPNPWIQLFPGMVPYVDNNNLDSGIFIGAQNGNGQSSVSTYGITGGLTNSLLNLDNIGDDILTLVGDNNGSLSSNSDPASGSFIPDSMDDLGAAQRDPLVIDFAGNGLNLVSRSALSPYFDFTGAGFAHNTGWVGAGSGFLALVGADGLVHDGTQLFGTGSRDGFNALRALDSNGDGVIDASDANFSKLVVWQDTNRDGVCQASEVFSLTQLGIVSISLHTSSTPQALGDATVSETALATMADGTTREIAEVNLDVSSVYTRYVGPYTLDPTVYALPGLQGYGTLPSLSISMSQDGQLKTLMEQLVQTAPSDLSAFDAALQAVLYQWAGVTSVDPASGDAFDGQKLGFLQQLLGNTDKFGGWQWAAPWFAGQSNLLQKSWDEAFAGLKARILVQLPDSPFESSFTVFPGTDLLVPRGQLSAAISNLAANVPTDPGSQLGYWSNVLLLVNTSVSDFKQFGTPDIAGITASLQAAIPGSFSPEILAAAASGSLNFVEGTALGRYLAGTAGSDLLTAEQPNAVLTGFGGGDEFVVGTGLGAIEINEDDNAVSAHNVLLLDGVTPSQVAVSGDAAGDLILTLGNGDTIKLDNMLIPPELSYQLVAGHENVLLTSSTRYGVQEVRFADGTVWTAQQLEQMELSGSTNGGATIYGTQGADLLDGQGIKHVLQGNGGGDTFVFASGYGSLEINEADASANPSNVLQFGPGITASQVEVSNDANGDVVLTIGNSGDAITLDGMALSSRSGVQQVRFADGTVWTRSQMQVLAEIGTPGDTSLAEFLGSATIDPAGYAHRGVAGSADTSRQHPDHERRQLPAAPIRQPQPRRQCRGGAKPGRRRDHRSRHRLNHSRLTRLRPALWKGPRSGPLHSSSSRRHWPAFTPPHWPGIRPPLTRELRSLPRAIEAPARLPSG